MSQAESGTEQDVDTSTKDKSLDITNGNDEAGKEENKTSEQLNEVPNGKTNATNESDEIHEPTNMQKDDAQENHIDTDHQEQVPTATSPDTTVAEEIPTPVTPKGGSDIWEFKHSGGLDPPNDEGDQIMGLRKRSNIRRKFGIGTRRQNGVLEHTSRLVGEYQIGNTLGRGCFGHTLSGISVNSNASAVLKQFDPKKVPKECHETLKREIQTLITLNHPNIVTFKSVIFDEEACTLYVVMDHLENGSIFDVIQKFGPLPEPLVAKYTSQVLDALETLHENNIIHRNLKSSNALLKNGDVKISDFYVGVRDEDRKYMIAGSPYWMAPELFDMTSSPACSADIWSIGCLVLEMYTGSPPHRNLAPMAAIIQLVREGLTLPDGLPVDLQDFLSHCFQKDPSKRKDAKFLRNHVWILKHENAKKEISEYAPRQPASVAAQASPLEDPQKSFIHIDALSDKDKEDISLAEFLQSPTDAEGSSTPTVQETFKFKKSANVPSSTNESTEELKKEIDQLRKLNDENVTIANEMRAHMEQIVSDQYRLARLTSRQLQRVEAAEEQLRAVARATAHSNMLLKRTNQLATDAISKNNIISINIKRIEEMILEGDSGPKKLAQLLYKKLAADSLTNLTISAFLSYSSSVKAWKEKRGWFAIKDNFLFIYKNEKGSAPTDIFYLGDGARLMPLSEDQIKRKQCFKFGEALLIATDTAEQCAEWMLALSTPQKWYESSEDMTKPKGMDKARLPKSDSNSPALPPRPSPQQPQHQSLEAQPVFGVSLEELFARENGNIPTFYSDMITFLQEKALHEEGILRLSGGLSEINAMRAALQNGEHVDFYVHDHNAVAGLLKCFFRELPEPLIPEPYHSNTYELMSNTEMLDEQRIVELKMIIDQLPPENYNILQILMNFLVQVNMASDKNKMTVQNLITCMVPTLKCVPGVFMYAIPNYDFIFGNWEGESTAS